MRLVFLGSGSLACPALERILKRPRDTLVGVVTQPPRPAGRGQCVRACPVLELATRWGVPVRTPERVNDPAEVAAVRAWRPDLLVVAAYGQLLGRELLSIAPLGGINVHPSLLPRYRGAAPIQWAIANGETETGVTIQFLSERMDAGDIILARREPIRPDDTAATLEPRLAALGAELLERALDLFHSPPVPRTPQDESQATRAPKLRRDDGRVDWRMPAEQLRNRIRGFYPWPGCFTMWGDPPAHLLKIHAARVEPGQGEPGRILEWGRDGPLVATGQAALRLTRVQPEGRPVMDGGDFGRGYAAKVGERFI